MTSTRAASNRANAQHSTGPRTEAGKQRSALNATRHALTGQTIVLPSDDLDVYRQRLQRFFAEYQPQGETEKHLVQTLADAAWRMNRIAALENNLFTLGIIEHQENVDTDHPQVRTALATAKSYREQHRALANLSLHEQRLARLFEKTLKQLREIQAERMEMHNGKGLPSAPAKNGFVFSNAEIETGIHHQNIEANNKLGSYSLCPPCPPCS